MNSLDCFEREARLDSSLRHVLKNWALRQRPPRRVRSNLLDRAAAVEKQRRKVLFLENDGPFHLRHRPGTSLIYVQQISFTSLLIHY